MTPSMLPHAHITVLFTDVENSSRINNALGNALYTKKLREPHFERLRTCVSRYKGHVVGTPAGDSLMVVFQNPNDALACAKSIQESLAVPPLSYTHNGETYTMQVRIGVHTAQTQIYPKHADDYSGDDANFAARVEALGAGGQIIVHDSVRKDAGTWNRYAWQAWPNRRLKSFDKPEVVYELLWDGEARNQVNKAVSRGEPGAQWLPDWYRGERNAYIAREDKEKAVLAHFAAKLPDGSPVRLVTLKGFGGMGKTRLGLTCGLQCAGLFDGKVYFVTLADREKSSEAVAEAIGTVFGLEGEARLPRNLLPLLRDTHALLILDNYESVHCADVQKFLRDLLYQTSHLCLLVTGREAVKIASLEQPVDIEGLTEPEARQLFLARAQLVQPAWQPTMPQEENALAAILRLTERNPLALELVAAGMGDDNDGSVELVAQSLEVTPLPALPDGFIAADPSVRHESLTRCLDWSYNLLESEAQDCFVRLGLFADTFTPETAEAATGANNSVKFLQRLAQASLIKRVGERSERRFTFLRPTRAYAQDKFNTRSDADTLRRKYVTYYLQFAAENRDIQERATLEAIEIEWPNALAAASIAHQVAGEQSVYDFSTHFQHYVHWRGKWTEGEQLNRQAVASMRNIHHRIFEAKAIHRLGSMLNKQERGLEAKPLFELGVKLSHEIGDQQLEIDCLIGLGTALLSYEDWQEAERCYKTSITLSQARKDEIAEAHCWGFMGCLYRLQRQWNEAERCYQKSLSLKRANDISTGVEVTLNHLGNVYMYQDRWQEAEENFKESIRINQTLGNLVRQSEALSNFAQLRKIQGNVPEALAIAQQALEVLQKTQETRLTMEVREWMLQWETLPEPVKTP